MTTPVETLTVLRELHRPYVSVPLDIVTGVPWEPGAESHPASPEEQAAGLRYWCEACRADAPCAQWLLITASIGEGQ